MKLMRWLEINKIRQLDFSRDFGINRQYLCKILKGQKKPGVAMAKRIEEYTQGDVTAMELIFPKEN